MNRMCFSLYRIIRVRQNDKTLPLYEQNVSHIVFSLPSRLKIIKHCMIASILVSIIGSLKVLLFGHLLGYLLGYLFDKENKKESYK